MKRDRWMMGAWDEKDYRHDASQHIFNENAVNYVEGSMKEKDPDMMLRKVQRLVRTVSSQFRSYRHIKFVSIFLIGSWEYVVWILSFRMTRFNECQLIWYHVDIETTLAITNWKSLKIPTSVSDTLKDWCWSTCWEWENHESPCEIPYRMLPNGDFTPVFAWHDAEFMRRILPMLNVS